jgi:hypothetical protein
LLLFSKRSAFLLSMDQSQDGLVLIGTSEVQSSSTYPGLRGAALTNQQDVGSAIDERWIGGKTLLKPFELLLEVWLVDQLGRVPMRVRGEAATEYIEAGK